MTKTTGTPPRAHSRIWAFMPAHNEAATIADSIRALQAQSRPPERIVVVLDNCTDDTAVVAAAAGADLHFTNGNTHKKAGALNQAAVGLPAWAPGRGTGARAGRRLRPRPHVCRGRAGPPGR